jgi:hypothetical protein
MREPVTTTSPSAAGALLVGNTSPGPHGRSAVGVRPFSQFVTCACAPPAAQARTKKETDEIRLVRRPLANKVMLAPLL